MALALPVAVAFVTALLLTDLVRRYAWRHGLIDIPDFRSSHSQPMPRGGGLAVVVASTVAWGLLFLWHALDPALFVAIAGGGLVVAILGLIDDWKKLGPVMRLAVHFVAAAAALSAISHAWVGTLGTPMWLEPAVLLISVAWFLNLFNFMDGIDGIAGAQAVFVAGAYAFVMWLLDADTGLVAAWCVVAAATAGFLPWNWPPARIFMGDVGSGFLGFVIALLAVYSVSEGCSLWVAVTLNSLFLADTGVTLLRRMLRGDQWYRAHRTHSYQRLALRWSGHAPATWAFAVINVSVVLPLAIISATWNETAPWVAVAVLGTFCALAWKLGSGLPYPNGERGPAA